MSAVTHRHSGSGSTASQTGAAFCPWCGYDLSGIGENTCPECGRIFGPSEVAAVAAHHRLVVSAPRIWSRFFGVPLLVSGTLMTLMIVMGSPIPTALTVLAVGVAIPLVTVLAGVPVVLFSRPWERAAVLLSWVRHALWLLLAWLALPAIAILAGVALTVLGGPTSIGSDRLLVTLIVVAPFWATLTLAGALAWAGAWFESERHVKHRPRVRALAVFAAAALTLLLAIGAALWTGAVVAMQFLMPVS
jgi:hypothetical protein